MIRGQPESQWTKTVDDACKQRADKSAYPSFAQEEAAEGADHGIDRDDISDGFQAAQVRVIKVQADSDIDDTGRNAPGAKSSADRDAPTRIPRPCLHLAPSLIAPPASLPKHRHYIPTDSVAKHKFSVDYFQLDCSRAKWYYSGDRYEMAGSDSYEGTK